MCFDTPLIIGIITRLNDFPSLIGLCTLVHTCSQDLGKPLSPIIPIIKVLQNTLKIQPEIFSLGIPEECHKAQLSEYLIGFTGFTEFKVPFIHYCCRFVVTFHLKNVDSLLKIRPNLQTTKCGTVS